MGRKYGHLWYGAIQILHRRSSQGILLSQSVLTFSMEITLPLSLEDDECMLL